MNRSGSIGLVLLSAVSLGGCGVTQTKTVDYQSAAELPSLAVPPDLTAPEFDERYSLPAGGEQGTSYSDFAAGQNRAAPANSRLLPGNDKVRVERAGNERWLVVQADPQAVWPEVKKFWQELGFAIEVERPEAGLLETDWAENRAKIPQDPIRNVLSKFADQLYSSPERDKFRTRLEPGKAPGTTEIYVSNRRMEQVSRGSEGNEIVWEARPADPDLEAEMLRLLMVRFGVEEAKAETLVATEAAEPRAALDAMGGQEVLVVREPFDRAWRRVGLALDRIGFTVEDRDRSQGVYFVRYVKPEETAKGGVLSRFAFWRDESDAQGAPAVYRVAVQESGEGSVVRLLAKDGKAAPPVVREKVLNLLYEQLK